MTKIDFIQSEIMKIVLEFDTFCKKNNIEYSMCGGTLLGAVRHKGFIPWDDDFDVYVTRGNMDKIIQYWHSEKYQLISKQQIGYHKPSTPVKIHNPKYTIKEKDDEKYGLPAISNYGIFIDIFPIDFYQDKYIDRSIQKYFGKILQSKHLSQYRYKEKIVILTIAKFIPKLLLIFMEQMIKRYLNKETATHVGFGHDVPLNTFFMSKKEFFPLKKYNFQDITLYGPNNADMYLSQRFGDYMKYPQKDQRKGHIESIYEKLY